MNGDSTNKGRITSELPTLIIGDVHGHYDRLLALLRQEGLVCSDSEERTDLEARIIQLGDLGHFGITGSPTGDLFCYELARDIGIEVLFGNHDRAVVDSYHKHTGYESPDLATIQAMDDLVRDQRMNLATSSYGFVIVHAGIHRAYDKQYNIENADELVQLVNGNDLRLTKPISSHRGGASSHGGILWMDWRYEKHSEKFKYICGHTCLAVREKFSGVQAEKVVEPEKDSYGNWNIDIGTIDNGLLAGIWLPEERIVTIKSEINQDLRETSD